jgi:hypothetical protein
MVKRAPEGETKRQKFVRLVDPRVKRAIRAIRLVAQLGHPGNRSHYEYSSVDIDRISTALTEEIAELAERMQRPAKQLDIPFSVEAE